MAGKIKNEHTNSQKRKDMAAEMHFRSSRTLFDSKSVLFRCTRVILSKCSTSDCLKHVFRTNARQTFSHMKVTVLWDIEPCSLVEVYRLLATHFIKHQ
jgi:hypothetical protein